MNYRFTTIDGFAERGRRARACLDASVATVPRLGLELAYDRQEETSLTTTVGLFASLAINTGFGVLIPAGHVRICPRVPGQPARHSLSRGGRSPAAQVQLQQ